MTEAPPGLTYIGLLCNIAWVSQPTQPPRPLEELSAELVLYTGRLVRAVTRRRRTSTQVPTASLRLLSQLDELGPLSIGALAAADRCSQPTMSGRGRSAVRARLGQPSSPNPRDARSSLVDADRGRSRRPGRRPAASARAVVTERLRSDPHHDEQDLATAVAVLRGLLEQPDDDEEGTA